MSKSTTTDRHANARDRKRERAMEQKTMRGNRSVFEIQKAIVKRGKAHPRLRVEDIWS